MRMDIDEARRRTRVVTDDLGICRMHMGTSAKEAGEILDEVRRLAETRGFRSLLVWVPSGETRSSTFNISWRLTWRDDGIVTIGRDAMAGTTKSRPARPRPDDRWTRRPVSEGQADAIVSALVEDLGRLSRCSPDDMGEEEVYETLGRYAIGGLLIEGRDGTVIHRNGVPTARMCLPQDLHVRHWLDERLEGVFRSVLPPDMRDAVTRMSYFEYGSATGAGDSSRVMAGWTEDGSLSMTYAAFRGGHGDAPREGIDEELPLTQADWEELGEAIVRADLPSWGDACAYRPSDGLTTVSVGFSDGWLLCISGSGQWDSRCLPIVEFIARHATGDEGEGLWRLRQREGDLQAIQETVGRRWGRYGGREPLCIHSDLPGDEAWEEVAATVRMRCLADGMLVCDVSPGDVPDYDRGRFKPYESPGIDLPERWATVTIRPVRDLPTESEAESEGVGVLSVFARMRNKLADVAFAYKAPSGSEAKGGPTSWRLMSILRGLRGVTWNDPSDVVLQACATPPAVSHDAFVERYSRTQLDKVSNAPLAKSGTASPLGLPRDLSWYYVEVVWSDESISFAHSDEPIGGLPELCMALAELSMRDRPVW